MCPSKINCIPGESQAPQEPFAETFNNVSTDLADLAQV